MQNQVQLTKWHLSINSGWCDQPVGNPWSISVFKLHLFWLILLNILPQVLCSQPLLKDSLKWSILSEQNILFSFYQVIECWSSFAISWCRWNWSHGKGYILGLANLLYHITKNLNPNCKPVSVFQILSMSAVAYIKIFPIKRVVSVSPA